MAGYLKYPNPDWEEWYWSSQGGRLVSKSTYEAMVASQNQQYLEFDRQIVFPRGSYHKVYYFRGLLPNGDEDYGELGPDDESNVWVREQQCVQDCSFRVTGKRPIVIRDHFAKCERRRNYFARAGYVDILGRFMSLQAESTRAY